MKLWLVAVRDLLPERQEKSMKQLIPQREDENQTDNIRHQELLFHFGFFQQTGKALDKMGAVQKRPGGILASHLANWISRWEPVDWFVPDVSRDAEQLAVVQPAFINTDRLSLK